MNCVNNGSGILARIELQSNLPFLGSGFGKEPRKIQRTAQLKVGIKTPTRLNASNLQGDCVKSVGARRKPVSDQL